MTRVVSWLQRHENRVFCFVNQKIHHHMLDYFFNLITHLGGASASIISALCFTLFSKGDLRLAGIHSCIALALSHIPVAVIKRMYPRLRPYLVVPDTNTCKKPLTDHSFPSGHTTAVFSVTVPFAMLSPFLAVILLPLASLVGISRIYLGLHYPSDVAVGILIGSVSAVSVVAIFS